MPTNFIWIGCFWVIGKCELLIHSGLPRVHLLLGNWLTDHFRLCEFATGSVESTSAFHLMRTKLTEVLDRLNCRHSLREKITAQESTVLRLGPLNAATHSTSTGGHSLVEPLTRKEPRACICSHDVILQVSVDEQSLICFTLS
jgi:hypothetical protein